jgi:hypothetical protein
VITLAFALWGLNPFQSRPSWVPTCSDLTEEGKKAASMLEGLRNAYASAGFEQISTLLAAMKDYLDAVRKPFAACSNPETAFLEATSHFVDFLIDAERNAVETAARLLKIDEQERKERPDIGSRGHDAVPPPAAAVGGDSCADRAAGRPTRTGRRGPDRRDAQGA